MATELIGDFGLAMGGAAGDELDRLDFELGTPPQALLLASSTGHNRHYQQVIEDIPQLKSQRVYGGSTHPPVRDMVYFETGIFSVGSMTFETGNNVRGSGLLGGIHDLVRQPVPQRL